MSVKMEAMDKKAFLEPYYSRLIALERRAPLTAETYRTEIRKFLDWLEKDKNANLKEAGQVDLSRYLSYRRNVDGIDSRSVAKAISALRSFYRFLEEDGFKGSMGSAKLLESPKKYSRLPEVHSREDIDRLLNNITSDTPIGIRNRTLYELVYSSGLRVSETVSLNLLDLSLDKNLARVRGKGSKERMVIFGSHASYWLNRYLKESRPVLLGSRISNALFINKYGKRLSRKGIWKTYNSFAVEAGLSTKLHTLRHSFATELLSGGADLRSVQELMGHADIATTQIYTHVDQSRLKDSHKKYLPNLKNWSSGNG